MTLVKRSAIRSRDADQPSSSAAATADPVSSSVPGEHRRCNSVDVIVIDRLEIHHLGVDPMGRGIEEVRDATGHPGGEVAANLAEYDDAAAGHVLAAVITDTFHDRSHPGVAHAESFADPPRRYTSPRRRAVADHVAGDDVFLGGEGRRTIWTHDDPTAG